MYDLIINPNASRGKAAKKAAKVIRILEEKGVAYTAHYTTREKEASELAKRLSENGATDIIALGGDGTLNEVLNGIDVDKVNLGVIPSGTGNDFVAAANIPVDEKAALDVILNCEPKPTDYMVCDGIRGLNIIGTGIDVDILKRCKKAKFFKGKLQYLISLIVSLIKFEFYKFKIVREDVREDKEALIACVGNGLQFGGGIKMCPKAIIDDGELDFVVAGRLKKARIPFAFVKLMQGKILEQDFTSMELCDRVQVEFDNPVTIQIDGELYDGLNFDVSIRKSAVKIYRP